MKNKIPRGKFNTNIDLSQYAKDHKNQIFNQFQSQIQNQMQFTPNNYNINYNINQNISKHYKPLLTNTHTPLKVPQQFNNYNFSNTIENFSNSSILNSLCDEDSNSNFIPIRSITKKSNSSINIKGSIPLPKNKGSSLFLNADKEEKGDDFCDLQELLDSINIDLWEYAKTQKGSRNLQKLLNKIQPESLDEILEKLKNNFPELMIDNYGNYFCQKLIQSCSSEQRMFILKHVNFLNNL
jgi:hypothetical protein